MVITILLAGVGFVEVILAGMVLKTRSNSIQNIYFAIFVAAAILWEIGDALMLFSTNKNGVHIGTILFLTAPLYTSLFVLYFARIFPGGKESNHWINSLLALPTIIFTIFTFVEPTMFVKLIAFNAAQNSLAVYVLPYALYTVYFMTYLGLASFILMNRQSKSVGVVKTQIAFSNAAMGITSAVSFVSNLALPLLGVTHYVWIGPLSTIAFTTLVFIAIIKHRLFDIRLVVARSLGYAFSVLVLGSIYGFVVFGLAKLIFDIKLSFIAQAFLSIGIGIVGLSFQRVKITFDKISTKLFYHDAYESQELLDQLNKILVSTTNLDQLLQHSSVVMAEFLKAEFCVIGLREDNSEHIRIVGTQKIVFKPEDIALTRRETLHIHKSVINSDMLVTGSRLKDVLGRNNIAVLIRLCPNIRQLHEGIGYILLAPKKSGNPYNNQDSRVLDIIAKELILAIQNALRFEEIENFNRTLQDKVNEATRKLRRSNEKLKELDETKDDFISMASHQLRTPLTSVKGYISMVLEEDAGKITPTQRDMLGQAFFSSQRMVYLIADLLNVSRLKTGKFIIERTPIQLDQIVQQELRQLQETAAARSLTLQFDKPDSFPVMMLDETKTRQIIMNFIDNAIYYTPTGGHIIVRLINNEHSVELRVEDNGIGVPKNEQQHLFTKFYRAGNARQARPDGTGLGLYMAKKVIVAQGGSLIFNSVEGQGSSFGFVFSKNLAADPDITQPILAIPAVVPTIPVAGAKKLNLSLK